MFRLQVANGVVEESRVRLAEPPGVIGAIPVSLTVTVQDVAVFTKRDAGVHTTLVVVGSEPTLRDSEPQELEEAPYSRLRCKGPATHKCLNC
jgi:hypothetical protein